MYIYLDTIPQIPCHTLSQFTLLIVSPDCNSNTHLSIGTYPYFVLWMDPLTTALSIIQYIIASLASLTSATPGVAYARFTRSLTWA